MSKKRMVGISFLAATAYLLVGCGDTPSELGNLAKESLAKQKNSFESATTQTQFKNFIADTNLSPELKKSALNAYTQALQLSASVKPDYAKNAVESSEMALACVLTLLKDENEVDSFISNATNSITDNTSRVRLFGQFIEAKRLVATAAINKENCK